MITAYRKRRSRNSTSRRAVVAVAAAGTGLGLTYLARRQRRHGRDELQLTDDLEPIPATSEEAYLSGQPSASGDAFVRGSHVAPAQHAIGEDFAGHTPGS